jgi:K+-transporting ATPase ATPase C chain
VFQQLRTATLLLTVFTVLTGGVYPAIVTGIAQTFFPFQANGSIIQRDGKDIGSALIGQSFSGPEYFWSRLSATSVIPYNAAASSGSNYGPMHPALAESAASRVAALQSAEATEVPVPVDLVTSSASGLDPHISPAAAEFQIPRIARARNLSDAEVQKLITAHTEARTFGLLGEPRVNVLLLNLSLDRLNEER